MGSRKTEGWNSVLDPLSKGKSLVSYLALRSDYVNVSEVSFTTVPRVLCPYLKYGPVRVCVSSTKKPNYKTSLETKVNIGGL